MGMPKIRHVHGHDQVGMPMDMPTLTCPGMSTGMPGLACQGSSIHPDMHTDMQGRHAQGHTGRRGHASRMRRLRADALLGTRVVLALSCALSVDRLAAAARR